MKNSVRLWWPLITILLVLCVLIGTSVIRQRIVDSKTPTEKRRATVLVPEPVQSLGDVSDQKEQEVVFAVRNIGNMRLVLNELDLGCCGNSTTRTMVIPPGKTAEIAVPLDTRFATGWVENVASFATSDPSQPRITLTVRAFVSEPSQPKHN